MSNDHEESPAAGSPTATAPAGATLAVVGVGASAGGLSAIEAFFSELGFAGEMAFVVVQHLAPDHESLLATLIQRSTSMAVETAGEGVRVQPAHIYVIPPDRDLALEDGVLRLRVPDMPRGHRAPIDSFFTSLARDQGRRAVSIVLSGTGTDGSLGIRTIKGEGGVVMVQSPDSAEYDGMPRAAIATGLVDFELPPNELATTLRRLAQHGFGDRPAPGDGVEHGEVVQQLLSTLHHGTGHDFAGYKRNTILRRAQRRMAIRRRDGLEEYVQLLEEDPSEVEALFRDLLIGVTRFFRDPATFDVLQQRILPRLLTGRSAGSVFRAWVVGCSTGEEAYSIAILAREWLEQHRQDITIQIFASDIDARAISAARAGIYPLGIAEDVSADRLARFFVLDRDNTAYRVVSRIRESLIFSEHDVLRDPPFSYLDLVSCRNLLIYLEASAQQHLLPVLHYALNPGGVLFLGSSETVGPANELFEQLDRSAKIYGRLDEAGGRSAPSPRPHTPPWRLAPGRARSHPTTQVGPASLREIAERGLLEHSGLVGMLVTADGDLLYVHGRAGLYLEPAMGETSRSNVFKMAREGLGAQLFAAVREAASSGDTVRRAALHIKTNGDFADVDLTVRPQKPDPRQPAQPGFVLVVIEPRPPSRAHETRPSAGSTSEQPGRPEDASLVAALRQELSDKDAHLEAAHEEMQTTNEELESSNQELQSMNEELQSTNEELETSKEELQSVNEELATVNAELQANVAELTRLNNDLNNLFASTDIGTMFVDTQLRIQRFTPALRALINVIDGDVGRPLAHVVSNLVDYSRLAEDTRAVLDSLEPREVEVESTAGQAYLLRIRPYRTTDNVVEGAVLAFIDVTDAKRARAVLRDSEALRRLAAVVRDARDGIVALDLDGRITAWNRAAERLYGWTEEEAIGMNVREMIPPDGQADALEMMRRLSRNEVVEPHRAQRITKDGRVIDILLTATALADEVGRPYALATTDREVGE